MPDVVLTVGGTKHAGWKKVSVSTSMSQLSGSFDLDVSERWPGQPQRVTVRPGQACTLHLGSELIITGYVDEVSPHYGPEEHGISVRGRDRTCDLVDCCHDGAKTQWPGESLLTIAQQVCAPFGVSVAAEADLGAPLPDVRYGQGDSVHEFLTRLARQRAVTMLSYGDGRLVFTRAGQGRAGSLILGQNIKTGRGELSDKERHSKYIVKGSGSVQLDFSPPKPGETDYADSLKLFGESFSPQGVAVDGGISRHRPLIVQAEAAGDVAAFEARARWEAATRAGKSRKASYTVQGWTISPGGPLWRINRLVSVQDAWLGLSGDFLIEACTYSLDESGGTTTQLGVVHPDAYKAQPNTDKANFLKTLFDQAK